MTATSRGALSLGPVEGCMAPQGAAVLDTVRSSAYRHLHLFCGVLLCPWTETQLHVFTDAPDDGAFPGNADLVFDPQGNIYGTTLDGGSGSCMRGCGTVYELSEKTEAGVRRF